MGVRVKRQIMDLRFIDIDEMIANVQQVLGRRRVEDSILKVFIFLFFLGVKNTTFKQTP